MSTRVVSGVQRNNSLGLKTVKMKCSLTKQGKLESEPLSLTEFKVFVSLLLNFPQSHQLMVILAKNKRWHFVTVQPLDNLPWNFTCKNYIVLQYGNYFFLPFLFVCFGCGKELFWFWFNLWGKFILRKVFYWVVENWLFSHESSGILRKETLYKN